MGSDFQGVILAAGHGSRMGPFGEEFPKPIAPICNKPLMAYQLEHLRDIGITDVIVVIGHLGHRITQAIGDGSAFGVKVRYVEQAERLGLAHAVGQLEPHLSRPFMLLLGDIFFEVDNLRAMRAAYESGDAAAVLAVKNEPDPQAIRRNFAVHAGQSGHVTRVIEKPRRPRTPLKGCGIYLFDERIFEAVQRTPRTAMRDEYELTDSIQILIDYGYPVLAAPVVTWDLNLTYVQDLITCCRRELGRHQRTHLIGHASEVHPDTKLIDTVVGNEVTITQPVRLERCVLLDRARLNGGQDYSDSVIGRFGVFTTAADG